MSAALLTKDAPPPPDMRQGFAAQIRANHHRIYKDVVAIGGILVEARNRLAYGEFLRMLDSDLPFSPRTAYNYIREWMMAQQDLQPAANLSDAYTVKAEIDRLEDTEMSRGIAEKRLYPGVTRAEVVQFRKEIRQAEPHRPRCTAIPAPAAPASAATTMAPERAPASSYSELVWLLAQHRKSKGMSQLELDDRCGWSQGVTSHLETPHTKDGRTFGPGTLTEWLGGLGVKLQVVAA